MIFILLMFCFVLRCSNIFLWWSIFVFIDLIFIFLCKNVVNYGNILNYFVIQEVLGLLFLIVNFLFLQFVVIIIKIGLAPFHFWIFSIIRRLDGWVFLWFLTFQKIPFIGILLIIFSYDVLFILFLGFFLCFLQLFLIKNYKFILTISSTESFNWILLGVFNSFFNGFILFLYYILIRVLLIPLFNKGNIGSNMDWILLLIYINIPLGMAFFVKIFVLSQFLIFNRYFLLLLLFLIFLNFLSLSIWIIIKRRRERGHTDKNLFIFFIIFSRLFILLLYYCSKNLLYYFDEVKLNSS